MSSTETIKGEKDPTNHTRQNTTLEGQKDATCSEPGFTGNIICECGVKIEDGTVTNATGEHSYNPETHKCVCGDVEKFSLTVVDLENGRQSLDVAYGTVLFDLAELAVYEESKEYANTAGNGYYEFYGWLDDADWLNAETTMPARDYEVVADGPYTGWKQNGEAWEYFVSNSKQSGLTRVIRFDHTSFDPDNLVAEDFGWADLGEDGVWTGYIDAAQNGFWKETGDGMVRIGEALPEDFALADNEYLHYIVDGISQGGLRAVNGEYYFFRSSGRAATGAYYAWIDADESDELSCGNYEFGSDGRALNGLVDKAGTKYYYENGKTKAAGLIAIDDARYFIRTLGNCAVDLYYNWREDIVEMPTGHYEFDAEGKMLHGFVQKPDGKYYYINGQIAPAGLVKIGEHYYFIRSNGKCATGVYYNWREDIDLLPVGTYEFDSEGRMLNPPA